MVMVVMMMMMTIKTMEWKHNGVETYPQNNLKMTQEVENVCVFLNFYHFI